MAVKNTLTGEAPNSASLFPMRTQMQRNERIVVLTIVGMLALNYPWLSLFSKDVLMLGIPLLFLYLFGFWAVFIVLARLIIESGNFKKTEISSRATLNTDNSDRNAR
jgi:hypothetical protein